MKKSLYFISGMVAGAALFAAIRYGLAFNGTPSPDQSDEAAQASRTIARQKQRIAELEKQTASLAGSAGAASAGAPDDGAAPPNGPAAAGMAKMIQAVVQQQVDMKATALKSRLQLTDEQDQAVRDILAKQASFAQDMATKMFSGNLTSEDRAAAQQAKPPSLDDQLQQVLSPDQYAEYQNYQTEDRSSQAETVANVQLNQMQTMLQLTEDQKDQVFNALYQQTLQQINQQGGTGLEAASSDPAAQVEQQFQSQADALQSILTPEQFQNFLKFQDSQRSMLKAIMPGAAGAGAGNGSAPPQN